MSSKSKPYLDRSEKPVLRRSIAGFLDVLGFSQLVVSASSVDESQQILDKVATAISEARTAARKSFSLSTMTDPARWAVKFFSDNLVFGIPLDGSDISSRQAAWFALRCIQHYQLQMALGGFFVRGALADGHICLTDEIIFGSALVECYQLESKASIVPRVILDKPLVQLLANPAPAAANQPGDAGEWSCRYHNIFCHWHRIFCHWHRHESGYAERYRIARTDEQSVISRLSEFMNGKEPPGC